MEVQFGHGSTALADHRAALQAIGLQAPPGDGKKLALGRKNGPDTVTCGNNRTLVKEHGPAALHRHRRQSLED
jgi:hypothetical protein